MGTGWSQETDGSSSSQAQPPILPSRPQSMMPQTVSNTNSTINNNNNTNNDAKGLEKKGSSPRSQPVIPYKPELEATNIPQATRISIDVNNSNKALQDKKTELVKLPHNYQAIIKHSDSLTLKSSPENLFEQLYAGTYLNGRKQKYWLEKKGNINCFMVFANDLSITWAEDKRYWLWHTIETSEGKVTIAELINVCWLEVNGRFHTENLSPGVTYQVVYQIKLEYSSYGWEVPVNFRLTLPNGSKQEHQETLKDKQPYGEWIRVPVGEFKASHENIGEIEFSLYEIEGGNWKKGLVIKGASIEPKMIV